MMVDIKGGMQVLIRVGGWGTEAGFVGGKLTFPTMLPCKSFKGIPSCLGGGQVTVVDEGAPQWSFSQVYSENSLSPFSTCVVGGDGA